MILYGVQINKLSTHNQIANCQLVEPILQVAATVLAIECFYLEPRTAYYPTISSPDRWVDANFFSFKLKKYVVSKPCFILPKGLWAPTVWV